MPSASIVCDEIFITNRSDFPEDMNSEEICDQLCSYIGFGPFLLDDNNDLHEYDVSISFYKHGDNQYNILHRIQDYDSDRWRNNQIMRIKVVQENYNRELSFICHMSKQQYLDFYKHNFAKFEPHLDSGRFWSHLREVASFLSEEEVLSDLITEDFDAPPSFGLYIHNIDYPCFNIALTQNEDESFRLSFMTRDVPDSSTIIAPFIHLLVSPSMIDRDSFSYLISRENFLALFF